jgi:hypothetical protein
LAVSVPHLLGLGSTEVDSIDVLVWGTPYLSFLQRENSLRTRLISSERGPLSADGYRFKSMSNEPAKPIRRATCALLRPRSPSHSPAPQRCPCRAVARQLVKVGPAKGLARKPIAPALSARARTVSSGKAVMKMNGTR